MHNSIVKAYCLEYDTPPERVFSIIRKALGDHVFIDHINWDSMSYVSNIDRDRFSNVCRNGWDVDLELKRFFEDLLIPTALKPFKEYM